MFAKPRTPQHIPKHQMCSQVLYAGYTPQGIKPSDRPTVCPSDCPTIRPSVHPTVQPSDRRSVRPSDLLSIRPSGCPSVRPSDRPTIHRFSLSSSLPSAIRRPIRPLYAATHCLRPIRRYTLPIRRYTSGYTQPIRSYKVYAAIRQATLDFGIATYGTNSTIRYIGSIWYHMVP